MTLIQKLADWVEKKPLLLVRFNEYSSESLLNSRKGLNHFTFTRPHREFGSFKFPTLCIVETSACDCNPTECFIGVITYKSAVSTFDSRATVSKLRGINIPSLRFLGEKITDRHFTTLFENLLPVGEGVSVLKPKLSSHIIEILATDDYNQNALITAARQLPNLLPKPDAVWSQENAIHTALAAFGLDRTAIPSEVVIRRGSSTCLADFGTYILEDNVISRDASHIPGFSLIEKDLTGRALFKRGEDHLEVYTANRGPLEEMLGVDLIYLNETQGNIVMLQYKMLEEALNRDGKGSDWIFRQDRQTIREIHRMRLPPLRAKADDYRLNANPFYFKFVNRRVTNKSPQSILVSLDHLKQLKRSPCARGPRGGVRVSYQALGGTYLREPDIISLIRSGYIGTHRVAFNALKNLIYEVSRGNKSLVLAWKKSVHREGD